MKERIKKEVVGRSVAIHITNKSQFKALKEVAIELGIQPLSLNYEDYNYNGNFCVRFTDDFCTHSDCEYFVYCGYKVIEFSDLCKNDTIVIYRKDNEVIALDKSTGKKAVAKCNPADEFNFNTGAKLAFERLTRNVTFRVLCVEDISYFGELALRGDVFEFVDGVTTWRTGEESLHYKSFENFMCDNSSWRKSFVELKEGDNPKELLKKYDESIKEGDTVKVIDVGQTYSGYSEWTGLKGYESHFVVGKLPVGVKRYRVLNVAKHNSRSGIIALIQDTDTTQVFMVNVKGLKKC